MRTDNEQLNEAMEWAKGGQYKDVLRREIIRLRAQVEAMKEVVSFAREVAMDAMDYHSREGWEMAARRAMRLSDTISKLDALEKEVK